MAEQELLPWLRGCGDHDCVIRKPEGQGTNGGCRCSATTLRNFIRARATTSGYRRVLEPIVACYGLGLSPEKFADQVGPWIMEARALLTTEQVQDAWQPMNDALKSIQRRSSVAAASPDNPLFMKEELLQIFELATAALAPPVPVTADEEK